MLKDSGSTPARVKSCLPPPFLRLVALNVEFSVAGVGPTALGRRYRPGSALVKLKRKVTPV